jgi:hypothetical protein
MTEADTDAPQPDSLTVIQAARLIGVSPKRVRQLVEAGTLAAIPDRSPMHVTAESVEALRIDRAKAAKATQRAVEPPSASAATLTPELVEAITQAALKAAAAERAALLELTEQAHSNLVAMHEQTAARLTDELHAETGAS